eukprot:CAMPEP_0202357776 /NCGR_PEP_ID=MMETSP1126-20121109/11671_1 /ASSEMBLY_ACC=CAM_ASM_000457 /TAXON_ID=3047 /ORGANISM="Dunaliella tertiolecta, Strain CCMP1320" /LENGTH=164 /DNA_ID=CAMNT_0048950731 /DNA_START=270 /DNA_END=764 /DNA_ORIENTATION=+
MFVMGCPRGAATGAADARVVHMPAAWLAQRRRRACEAEGYHWQEGILVQGRVPEAGLGAEAAEEPCSGWSEAATLLDSASPASAPAQQQGVLPAPAATAATTAAAVLRVLTQSPAGGCDEDRSARTQMRICSTQREGRTAPLLAPERVHGRSQTSPTLRIIATT